MNVLSDYPNAPADYNRLNAALDDLDDLLISAQQSARKGAPRYQIVDDLQRLQAAVNAAIDQAKAI